MLADQNLKVTVVNGGVSGDTTSGGRTRLSWMLKKHQPDIVLLALGGNDVLRGIPPRVSRDNILAMLTILQEQNVKTILSAVQAPDTLGKEYQSDFDRIYLDATKEYAVSLYPFLIEKTFGRKHLMQPDGIHPNKEGVKKIATDLAAYLVSAELSTY